MLAPTDRSVRGTAGVVCAARGVRSATGSPNDERGGRFGDSTGSDADDNGNGNDPDPGPGAGPDPDPAAEPT